ncbi:MAG TPA: P-loop NTPase [Planctomycetota bacterium]|nr:P-loop NTPase [Planctomycetota bacterium]
MQDRILDALRNVMDPDLNRDIVSLGFIKDLKQCDGVVSFAIELTTPACPVKEQLKQQAHRQVMSLPGVKQVDIKMTSQVRQTPNEVKDKLLPRVKNIIPVASGKGGVGKSTVSANLAVALAGMGAKVGLLDADIYGPSIPGIMGAATPEGGGTKVPPVHHGVKITSMGFFVKPGDVQILRGPMLHKALEFFLGQIDWGELDYLIVDLPPGTGDVHLSLCQMIPLTGAAVVSTPQDVALRIAEKAVLMFDKLKTPVLGLIENMSGYVCGHCGQREDIFGEGGARRYALERGLPFLGDVPLSIDVRKYSDTGTPIVIAAPQSAPAKAFMMVAQNLAAQVSILASGGGTDKRPIPQKIELKSRQELLIHWNDGKQSALKTFDLRINCPCAQCVDELSGARRLDPATVSKDVWPQEISPVGRYALNFRWSDGHSSGIYTFDQLRSLSAL